MNFSQGNGFFDVTELVREEILEIHARQLGVGMTSVDLDGIAVVVSHDNDGLKAWCGSWEAYRKATNLTDEASPTSASRMPEHLVEAFKERLTVSYLVQLQSQTLRNWMAEAQTRELATAQ